MYAKSFIAINTTGRLTSARSALSAFNHQYECHLCGCPMVLHDAGTVRASWFEHIEQSVSTRRHKYCPYTNPEQEESDRVKALRRLVPEVKPLVQKADWHCMTCAAHHHREKYCKPCHREVSTVSTHPCSAFKTRASHRNSPTAEHCAVVTVMSVSMPLVSHKMILPACRLEAATPFDKTRELALSVSPLSITSKGVAGRISCGKDLIVTAQRLDNLANNNQHTYTHSSIGDVHYLDHAKRTALQKAITYLTKA
ncbi:DUF7828 domain-containing protein [Yersinia intermedia]|uniref:DUF7828 domain-containing protein n=1 Tax=Yersinia intermedia TaxID=631 RepID=UPI00092D353F|nr:putative zinc ribbon protein [Yersinia intermedia]